MNKQILLETVMIGTMFLITAGYFVRSKGSTASKAINFITALLGGFLVMAGTAKFFLPFADIFSAQIALSGLPFPALSKFAGQMGEIFAGLLYLAILTEGKFISAKISTLLLQLATMLTVVIMSVAVYVHLSPNVPAEVLPLQSKPPVLTIIVMLISLGLWFSKRKA
ncbi:hypothetical protein [uncultured Shewanella sp.]|uniref:hypothetical protein n=1 Tax=uncultured Shewanella sp. TaxID=173975 RepID=UPI00261C0536|nr:hypothetical protein [uncultured Shewanella sp.]